MDIINLIEKHDTKGMMSLLVDFPEQMKHALELSQGFSSPDEFGDVDNVLFCGMGGSAIGGDLIRSYTGGECRIPVFVCRDYTIPEWAGENTLALISSYSGDTEETLSAYNLAISRGCKIACVTSGGKLADRAARDGFPLLSIPSGLPPRAALGYGFVPWLSFLASAGLISDKTEEIKEVIKLLGKLSPLYSPANERDSNKALSLAKKIRGKLPIIYVPSNAFGVVAIRWKNQIQENGKSLAYSNELPEMNHNEIMGWHLAGLEDLTPYTIFLTAESVNTRVEKRIRISKQIISKAGIETSVIEAEGNGLLPQMMSLIYLGDFVSVYLALIYERDPTPVDKIQHLKSQLASTSDQAS